MGHFINEDTDFLAVVNADRPEPWHTLGQRATEAFTAEVALQQTNMNWETQLIPMFGLYGEGDDAEVIMSKGKYMVVYPDPHNNDEMTELGVVGSRFTPVQNRELFSFMDGIVGEIGGAHYDTAGFLRPPRKDGTQMAQVFLTIDLADAGHVVLDPGGSADELNTKLFCMAGHDGSMSVITGESTTRIVCTNTQKMALRSASRIMRMKHTTNINARMDEAREAMGLVLKYIAEMHKAAEELVQQAYTDKEFAKLVHTVFPMPKDTDKERRKAQNVEAAHDKLRFCWKASPTISNIEGTKWGAYQAVVEYLDWYAPVREVSAEMERRAVNALVGPSAGRKLRTLQLLSA